MTDLKNPGEATGMITDLFTQEVGFSANWGLPRWIMNLSNDLLLPSGNIDWQSADMEVSEALSELVAPPNDPAQDLPGGVTGWGIALFGHVAASQHYSGWAPAGNDKEMARLVIVRCHMGKYRRLLRTANAVLVQYRLWTMTGGSNPSYVLEPKSAWSLLSDVHAEIERRLRRREL